MMDRLAELEVFVSIVDSGGFARAARKLRMSPAMVSTHLSRLETRLGVKLLDRTTRRIDLTQRGRSLLDDARHILGSLAAAEASVQGGGGAPSGRVRIDAPSAVGLRFIVPAIPAFRARYPQIVLDLSLGDRGSVLRPDRFDIVVRVGESGPSGAFVQSLGATRLVHVASPAYLARRPAPRTPDDLAEHDCILYASVELQADSRWRFARDGETRRLRPPAVVTFNHGDAIDAAAIAGIGIAQSLEMLVASELADGRLVRVLDDWNCDPVPVLQMSPRDRCNAPAVKAALGFLVGSIDWTGRTQPASTPRLFPPWMEAAASAGRR